MSNICSHFAAPSFGRLPTRKEVKLLVTKPKKRRRRTPEEAQAEILDAAENLLLSGGPSDLTFSAIASKVGLAKSNVHHHFGSLHELKVALVARMLKRVGDDFMLALSKVDATEPQERAEQALRAVYGVVAAAKFSRLVAWLSIFSEDGDIARLFKMVEKLQDLAVKVLSEYMPKKAAKKAAPIIMYQMTITAVGEGLVGANLREALSSDAPLEGIDPVLELAARHWE